MPNKTSGWIGWIYFASFMMIVLGFFQVISGLTALLNNSFYSSVNGHLLVWDITQWGWIHLFYGIVVLMAGISLFHGRMWARIVALILVTVNLLLQFAFISEYPFWAIIAMVIDVLIIFALTVHGDELIED